MSEKSLKIKSSKLPYAGIALLVALLTYMFVFPPVTADMLLILVGSFIFLEFVVMKICRAYVKYYHKVDRQLFFMETYLPMLFSLIPLVGPFFLITHIYKLMRGKIGGYAYREGGMMGSKKYCNPVNLKGHGVPAAIVLLLGASLQPLGLAFLPESLLLQFGELLKGILR